MMKKLFAATVVLGLMTATATPAMMTATAASPQKEKHERNEQHPHIKAALHELEEVRAAACGGRATCDCLYADRCYSEGAKLPNGQKCKCADGRCVWELKSLPAAKDELKQAAHDFGGHRAEAVETLDNAITTLKNGSRAARCEAIDSTIKQLRQALQYDKK